MKRKSPKNYRRKKRDAEKKYSNITTLDDGTISTFNSAAVLYFNQSNTVTTTIKFPTALVGDIITVSGCTEPKRAKKVHPARRRIPKRNNNGTYVITNADNNCITIENNSSTKACGTITMETGICAG